MKNTAMLDTALLSSIATQLMTGNVVEVDGKRISVRHTSAHRFKTVWFTMDGRQYQAIEQNPEKPSRWGKLARKGHQGGQFRDLETQKYVAAAVDGNVKEYGR